MGSEKGGQPVKEGSRLRKSEGQEAMPLLEALLTHAQAGRSSWHMPGHAGGNAWPGWFSASLAKLDVTELPATDDLNHPAGPALEAMELAAAACGAGLTRFITGGSTTALYVMLALAVGCDGSLLVSGTCHQAVIHAAALLNLELLPLVQSGFPPPDTGAGQPRFTLFPQATLADVQKAVAAWPKCRAVLLTSPDYYGGCAELAAISRFLHQQGKLLLVDEAHGAHLPYARSGQLPLSAMAAGADACVQSGHKTLPVMTGGALLHLGRKPLGSGALQAADLDRLLPAFQTSSPAFPVAASLDYARQAMQSQGNRQIDTQLAQLRAFRERLPDWLACSPEHLDTGQSAGNGLARDPLRLVLTSSSRQSLICIRPLARQLSSAGVDIEFADLTRLVLIPSLWQAAFSWQQLADCLAQLGPGRPQPDQAALERSSQLRQLEESWRSFSLRHDPVVSLREALFAPVSRQLLPIGQAVGHVACSALAPYPPGVPLVRPGERLDRDRVDFLRLLLENSISISGLASGKVQVFT